MELYNIQSKTRFIVLNDVTDIVVASPYSC